MKEKKTIEVQICPFGRFSNKDIEQVCDEQAFQALLENFSAREVLVDFNHEAETGGSTRAAGWLQSLRIDPEKGLMGTIELTEVGREAVEDKEYRFLSPCWEVAEDGRPIQLISIGLTNKPNIPVAKLLNRAPVNIEFERGLSPNLNGVCPRFESYNGTSPSS